MIGYWAALCFLVCAEFLVKVNVAETTNDPCSINPCKNDGVCIANSTDYICKCNQPYSGNHCEKHPCHSNPCLNDGACIAVENSYGCVCDEPFYGKHCENDPCTSNPCKNEGSCRVAGIDFTCTCKAPYFGKQCEMEFDTTVAEHTTTDNFSEEITTHGDECYCGDNSLSCRLDWKRKKLCFCKDGFEQRRGTETCSRTCQLSSECRNDGICDRDGPGYFCLCREPYIGDRCEVDVCSYKRFECNSMRADCVRNGTVGVCKCPIGTKMALYNYCEDACTNYTCVHGVCELTDSSAGYFCNCYVGYYGRHCENAFIISYVPDFTILVILALGIVLLSIASCIAGCWVKNLRLRKKIEENSKQTVQP